MLFISGVRAIAVAKSDDVTLDENGTYRGWYMVGLLTFTDPVRRDSAEVIKIARDFGVEVKMITGDAQVSGPLSLASEALLY